MILFRADANSSIGMGHVMRCLSIADAISTLPYYGSEEWYRDREGELPEGTRAGVLSEDAVYDSMTALRDTAIGMLELGTDVLKNWL